MSAVDCHSFESQWTTWRNQFPPFIMWVFGIELRSLHWGWQQTSFSPVGYLLPSFLGVYCIWTTSFKRIENHCLILSYTLIITILLLAFSRLKFLTWFPCPICTVIDRMMVHIFVGVLEFCICKTSSLIPSTKQGKKKVTFWCHIFSGVVTDYFNLDELI